MSVIPLEYFFKFVAHIKKVVWAVRSHTWVGHGHSQNKAHVKKAKEN
jgi:hypothetical protein